MIKMAEEKIYLKFENFPFELLDPTAPPTKCHPQVSPRILHWGNVTAVSSLKG
jgi:hypothetical protein